MAAEGVSVDDRVSGGRRGESCEVRVRIVCRGSSVSQESIQLGVGSKVPFRLKAAGE